jgi:hypothetical protein
MGHAVCAILVPGAFNGDAAARWDLRPVALAPTLTMSAFSTGTDSPVSADSSI